MSARSEADPQLGRTLGGQYRIEALLGYGGMGRVYRGLQLSVKRAVAIKLIAGQAPYPAEWVQRFRREAEATASLSHPNSVRLFDFGVTEAEELYMVMELLSGIDLAHQLQDQGALPLTAALSIARQVLLALCEAHALGITHRDIKPDNIFLANVRGAEVVAKVMDFGIAGLAQAQLQSRLTGTGQIIGTPLYMSPEQAQGLLVDGKSDVYSLGVVLFEMLTGRPVFESNTAVNLLLAHVARPPMRLQEAGVKLREEASLQALLDRLLCKDPGQRPSAAEALESITALAARLGVASATGSMRAVNLSASESALDAAAQPLATHAHKGNGTGGLRSARGDSELRGDAGSFASRRAAGDSELRGASGQDPSLREFQSVRVARAATSSALRPAIFVVGAGLVLTAATALALRWVPTLVDAAQPTAAAPSVLAPKPPVAKPQEPEERSVLVSSQPSGAQVFVAGTKVGTTPFELKLQRDTEISVAREGYRRKLLNVAYETRSPVFVKLQEDKKLARPAGEVDPSKRAPLVFSFGQESAPSVSARRETTADKARLRTPAVDSEHAEPTPPLEPVTPEPDDNANVQADNAPQVAAPSGDLYGPADLAAEHPQPSAAETSRSAALRDSNPPLRADELSEVALDPDEQAQVKENYGLRAVGRAVARAFGRLLIPYPNRARRAELADMPLAYPSFREARSAYQRREVDSTAFEEAVWQLRERRRRAISRERDLYARGQITQNQYESSMDRIWDEFWGQR